MALPSDLQAWSEAFPQLRLDPGDPVSPQTPDYNCIAFAAGVTDEWWDTIRAWPAGVPRVWSLDGLRDAFGAVGYTHCDDGSLEPGFEKVVLYARSSGVPTHAARQLRDGRWTSKCGEAEDIVHNTPECLSSPVYGSPVGYMRRPAP